MGCAIGACEGGGGTNMCRKGAGGGAGAGRVMYVCCVGGARTQCGRVSPGGSSRSRPGGRVNELTLARASEGRISASMDQDCVCGAATAESPDLYSSSSSDSDSDSSTVSPRRIWRRRRLALITSSSLLDSSLAALNKESNPSNVPLALLSPDFACVERCAASARADCRMRS